MSNPLSLKTILDNVAVLGSRDDLVAIAAAAAAGIAAMDDTARAANVTKLAELEAAAAALRESMGIKVPAKRGPKPKVNIALAA